MCRGDIQHEGAGADDIEAAIAESGGNVSKYLMPEERALPDGSHQAISALSVSFSLPLGDEADNIRLCVRFVEGYPNLGALPAFTVTDRSASAGTSTTVVEAAEAAARAALESGDSNIVYAAFGCARDALASCAGDEGAGDTSSTGDDRGDGSQALGGRAPASPPAAPAPPAAASADAPHDPPADPGAGAWAVLGGCGRPLYDVLTAWDSMRVRVSTAHTLRTLATAHTLCAHSPLPRIVGKRP